MMVPHAHMACVCAQVWATDLCPESEPLSGLLFPAGGGGAGSTLPCPSKLAVVMGRELDGVSEEMLQVS